MSVKQRLLRFTVIVSSELHRATRQCGAGHHNAYLNYSVRNMNGIIADVAARVPEGHACGWWY